MFYFIPQYNLFFKFIVYFDTIRFRGHRCYSSTKLFITDNILTEMYRSCAISLSVLVMSLKCEHNFLYGACAFGATFFPDSQLVRPTCAPSLQNSLSFRAYKKVCHLDFFKEQCCRLKLSRKHAD